MICETNVQGKWARSRFSECPVSGLTVTVALFTVVTDPVIKTVLVKSLTLVRGNEVNSVVEMCACVELTALVLVMVAVVVLGWWFGVAIVVLTVARDVVDGCGGWLHTTIMEPGTLSRPFIWSEDRTEIFKESKKFKDDFRVVIWIDKNNFPPQVCYFILTLYCLSFITISNNLCLSFIKISNKLLTMKITTATTGFH